MPIAELGPPVDPEGLVPLDLPEPVIADDATAATLLYVDSFGNIALNLDRDDVERLGVVSGTRVELELAGERYYAVMARTFADARPGDVILYEDSYKNMSLAISRGSAARMLHASPGSGDPDHDRELSHGDGRPPVGPRPGASSSAARHRRSASPAGGPIAWTPIGSPLRPVQRKRHRGQAGQVRDRRERRELRVSEELLDRALDASCQPIGTGGSASVGVSDDVHLAPERDDPARERLKRSRRCARSRRRSRRARPRRARG